MKNFYSRLANIEKIIEKLLHPYEERIILVNKSAGETKEVKIAEIERELGRKICKGKLIFFIVSGLTRI